MSQESDDDIFAEARELGRQLYRELAAQPIVEITGIVGASGVAGVWTRGDEAMSLIASFDGWRIGAGPVRKEELFVRRYVTDEELKMYQSLMEPETIVRIRGRVAEQNVFGRPEALLEEFVARDSKDAELRDYLAELKKPVIYDDEVFGLFAFDRAITTYVAETKWNGKAVRLKLWLDDRSELPKALDAARRLWSKEAAWEQRIHEQVVRELLPLKSQNWQEDDGSSVSREEFLRRMSLKSISVRADGSFDVCYDDGDLFWGHEIVVYGSLDQGISSAGIQG